MKMLLTVLAGLIGFSSVSFAGDALVCTSAKGYKATIHSMKSITATSPSGKSETLPVKHKSTKGGYQLEYPIPGTNPAKGHYFYKIADKYTLFYDGGNAEMDCSVPSADPAPAKGGAGSKRKAQGQTR